MVTVRLPPRPLCPRLPRPANRREEDPAKGREQRKRDPRIDPRKRYTRKRYLRKRDPRKEQKEDNQIKKFLTSQNVNAYWTSKIPRSMEKNIFNEPIFILS